MMAPAVQTKPLSTEALRRWQATSQTCRRRVRSTAAAAICNAGDQPEVHRVRCKMLAIKRNIAKWTPVGMGIVVSWPNPQVSDARLGAGKNSKRVVSPDVNWKAHSRTGIMVSVL